MKSWLKILCILLLVYVAVFSFLQPMGAGGLGISTITLHPGRNEFTFTGYGTHFLTEQKSLQVFVASDTSAYYCADILQVVNDANVVVSVYLPDTLSSNQFAFFANDHSDGTVLVEPPVGNDGFVFVPGTKNTVCKPEIQNADQGGHHFPFQPIIIESIRNLMWHVPMWFTMFFLMIMSFILSLRVLNKSGRMNSGDSHASGFASVHDLDLKAAATASTGVLFCTLGLITGSVWARFAWGAWWTNDPQLNGALVVFMVYVAYFILRKSTPDEEKRARISAIFNIFAFVLMVVLLMVMPRFTEGLHPGKSGNPAFSQYDLDSSLRMVFYPACLGFILLGYWLYNVNYRIKKIEIEHEENV